MKRTRIMCLAVFQAIFLAAGVFPQARMQEAQGLAEIRKDIKLLDLTDTEFDALEKVALKDDSEVAKAQAELKILQARLELLMLEKKPPMDEIKVLLRQSLEWEYKVRLIRLERNIAVRGILGEDRWARVYKLSKAWAQAKRTGKFVEDRDARISRALKLLEALQ